MWNVNAGAGIMLDKGEKNIFFSAACKSPRLQCVTAAKYQMMSKWWTEREREWVCVCERDREKNTSIGKVSLFLVRRILVFVPSVLPHSYHRCAGVTTLNLISLISTNIIIFHLLYRWRCHWSMTSVAHFHAKSMWQVPGAPTKSERFLMCTEDK